MKKDTPKSEVIQNTGQTLPKSVVQTLTNLRDRIDTIDRQIVELLAKRQNEVETMVSVKKAHNLPAYHPAREEDIISDRRRKGEGIGLDPDYLEELFRTILSQSRVEQTHSLAQKGVRPGASVLVVGGTRGLGRYFYQWFQRAGYKTRSMGSNHWSDIDTLCHGIDVAVISVPIDVTVSVIQKIAPYLPPHCILTDLTSIKGPPMKSSRSWK